MYARKARTRRAAHSTLDAHSRFAEFAEFEKLLREFIDGVKLAVDKPDDVNGIWWLEVVCGDFRTTASWAPQVGFGVFTDESSFGARPDELYRLPEMAAQRIAFLCEHWRQHRTLEPLWLGEVRRLTGSVQAHLATALSINQPAVSRLESRDDVKLSSLDSYVRAMGGRLEMRVHFSNWQAVIALPNASKEEKS